MTVEAVTGDDGGHLYFAIQAVSYGIALPWRKESTCAAMAVTSSLAQMDPAIYFQAGCCYLRFCALRRCV